MHTATQLDVSQFSLSREGRAARREDLLPGWAAHDRLGVVVTEPFGAVGASHLIQIAITAFYDARPSRRGGRPGGRRRDAVYPEIYLFHVGAAHGDHSAFDFWPARKEIIVDRDPLVVLDAINDRAVTRLAVPDRDPEPVVHEWKEPAAARDRIVSAFAYSPSGRVRAPTWEIRGLDPRTEQNPELILNPEKQYAGASGATGVGQAADPRRVWQLRAAARRDEARDRIAEANLLRRAIRDQDGRASETYREISVDDALLMLV
jgi:hypothetical protein